jgi:hypothetical protein
MPARCSGAMPSSATRTAWSAPTSVARRAQNPPGSSARGIDGTTVSQTARSVASCTSLNGSGMMLGRSLSPRLTGCRGYTRPRV